MNVDSPSDRIRRIANEAGDALGRGVGLAELPKHAQVVYLVWSYVGEVMNGGLAQFFYNHNGAYARETQASLRFVNLPVQAETLSEAADALFPDGDIPIDIDARNEVMCHAHPNVDAILDRLNEVNWASLRDGEHVYEMLARLTPAQCEGFSLNGRSAGGST